MKQLVTVFFASLLFVPMLLSAQPVRNGVDVIWAKDVQGATLTLDGVLSEPEWVAAETIPFVWNQPYSLPGSGQRVEGNPVPADPLDPHDAMMYVLRDGNVLWLGLMANDKSVGGGQGLWNFDGLIISLVDRSQRPDDFAARTDNNYFSNGATNAEWFFTFWNPADTTDAAATYDDGSLVGSGRSIPGNGGRLFGDYGVGFGEGNVVRDPADVAIWDGAVTVDGISNDDTHGDDVGYTMEMRIDLGMIGYDFSKSGGDSVPWNVALQDDDYSWPENTDQSFLSRLWWQNQWGNNFEEGVAFIHGRDDVTISSGPAPLVTDPEFVIADGTLYDAPTLDGKLDEQVWNDLDNIFYIQYEPDLATLDMNPGTLAPYDVSWFRPDLNGDGNLATVVDPSLATFKMFSKDNILYVGMDAADQAVSGGLGESGRDGFRIVIRQLDSLDAENTLVGRQFDVMIDSSGAVSYALDAAAFRDADPASVQAGVGLKGATTVADPSDIDEGYQFEVAIDLTTLGYEGGNGKTSALGDGRIWISLNFFDGDYLETPGDSYATRTWLLGERNQEASLYGWLEESMFGVAVEEGTELPDRITLEGNYPNPFNPGTTLRYVLPSAGEVTVSVFNVLGQKVAELIPGPQAAGKQQVAFNATNLSSGVYLYKVFVRGAAEIESPVGRMTLVK